LRHANLCSIVESCVSARTCKVVEQNFTPTMEAMRVTRGSVPLTPQLGTRLVVTDTHSNR